MKRFFSLCLILTIGLTAFSQMPKVTTKVKDLGAISPGKIMAINPSLKDTVIDTLFYRVLVNHDAFVTPYLSLLHQKPGSRDTTSVLTYWQSVDGVHNWQQVKYGKALGAYSTSIDTTSIKNATLANQGRTISFLRDTAFFESQYLGIRFISNAPTSGAKKAYYKPIYYGSIRADKK
jgi:hypothetical protein